MDVELKGLLLEFCIILVFILNCTSLYILLRLLDVTMSDMYCHLGFEWSKVSASVNVAFYLDNIAIAMLWSYSLGILGLIARITNYADK